MTQKKIDRTSSFEDTASVLKLSDRPSYVIETISHIVFIERELV